MSAVFTRAMGRVRSLLPARADFLLMARNPRRDLLAGLTVAIVALPLALGFGVSSGLGAAAGLATAVVAGALAALFGGSNLQVSGPTGAMTVVLVPIVAEYGPGGVLTVGVLAGLILIALALLRAGKYMQYIPAPVVEGFTLGIACVIGAVLTFFTMTAMTSSGRGPNTDPIGASMPWLLGIVIFVMITMFSLKIISKKR